MTKRYIENYPRPQFVRQAWENLNGLWNFAFDDGSKGEAEKWCNRFPTAKTIHTPFTYETPNEWH